MAQVSSPCARSSQSLQEGLSRYERRAGRVSFRSTEGNLAAAIRRVEATRQTTDKKPTWQQALASASARINPREKLEPKR
jgi:hypothetical protein